MNSYEQKNKERKEIEDKIKHYDNQYILSTVVSCLSFLSCPAPAPIPTPAPVPALLSSTSALVSPSPPLPCPVEPEISGFDISLLSPLQLTCPTISVMKSSPSLSVFSVPLGAECLLCNSSKGSLRPLVPLQLCRQLFNLLHDVSHPGVCVSQRLVSSKFVCPGFLETWAFGQDPVSGAKFQLMCILQFQRFLCLPEDSLMYTLT